MNSKDRFLCACRSEKTDRPPVWLMRQAGRYLPEYSAIRKQHTFREMVYTPEIAAELTLQPIRRFGMDAAILFCDILVLLESLGAEVAYEQGGPSVALKVKDEKSLGNLKTPKASDFEYVRNALGIISPKLKGITALIGFVGGPFTLAAYLVQGGPSKSVFELKSMAYADFPLYDAILSRISDAMCVLLKIQIEAGVDAVQIFDTWSLHLGPDDYARFALPYTRRVIERIKPLGVPVISFVRNAAGLLETASESGCDVLAVDSSIRLSDADSRLAPGIALQGNLDPSVLSASPEVIRDVTRKMHDSVKKRGLIFNVGTGLEPSVPLEGVEAFVSAVKGL